MRSMIGFLFLKALVPEQPKKVEVVIARMINFEKRRDINLNYNLKNKSFLWSLRRN